MAKKVTEQAGEQSRKSATWAKHVEGWEHSGQTQRAYCAGHGVLLSSFQWWRRKLRGPQAKKTLATFLPVPVAVAVAGAGTAVVEIELRSKTRLRLEGEAALRAVAGLIGRIR